MISYRFTSAALTELRDAMLYYEGSESGLGSGFLQEIEAALNRVLRNPLAWHQVSARTRRCRTHRFPFALLYKINSDEILIVAVMNLRGDPTNWSDLL